MTDSVAQQQCQSRAVGSARPRGTNTCRASCPGSSLFPACSLLRDTSCHSFPTALTIASAQVGCFAEVSLQRLLLGIHVSHQIWPAGLTKCPWLIYPSSPLQICLFHDKKRHRKTCAVGVRERIGASNLLWEPQKKNKTKRPQTNPTKAYEVAAGILSSIHPDELYPPISLCDFLFSFPSSASTVLCSVSIQHNISPEI